MRQRILNPEQLYSAYQLGLVLRLSADTIRKMARKHEIPYVMVGGRMQFCGWQIKTGCSRIRCSRKKGLAEKRVRPR